MTGSIGIIDPYELKKVLIVAIVMMFSIVVLLFLALLVHKAYTEIRERRLKRLKEIYISAITRKLIESDYEIEKPKKRIEFEALGDVVIDMLANISGEMEEKIREYAKEVGINKYYKEMANERSWIRQSVAIEKLGLLRSPEMKPFFHSLFKNVRDNELNARIILALSFIVYDEDDIRTINEILKNPLFRSSKFNEYIYTNIIKSFRNKGREDKFVMFLETLKDDSTIPVMLKRDIIEACGSEVFYPAKDAILNYFKLFNDTPEMKIACVRALGRIGGEDVCRIMESCLKDNDWRVRAVSAKNAYLCQEDIISFLRDALHDENYYVRINSANSLSNLGEKGLAALREEVNSPDRFTVDISRYILNEVKIRA